jgi:hypothetical protein
MVKGIRSTHGRYLTISAISPEPPRAAGMKWRG